MVEKRDYLLLVHYSFLVWRCFFLDSLLDSRSISYRHYLSICFSMPEGMGEITQWMPVLYDCLIVSFDLNRSWIWEDSLSLRIQICPKKGISPIILFWGWDWDHQEGGGSMHFVPHWIHVWYTIIAFIIICTYLPTFFTLTIHIS